jgi:hypothetical protein
MTHPILDATALAILEFTDGLATAFEENSTMTFTGAEVASIVRKLSEEADSEVRKAIDTLETAGERD